MGKDALLKRKAEGLRKKLVTLKVAADHDPAHGGASVILDGRVVGTVTLGDWGHRVGMNLAYAFIDHAPSTEGSTMQIDLCGDLVDAEVIAPSPNDPDYALMRG